MAERRMFAKSIVTSDAFLDMSCSTRCLFFHLGMVADDDGFVGSPKSAMRACGASEDDLKLLIAKRFLIAFPSGVVLIKAWKVNNYIRNDRYQETNYTDEKASVIVKDNGMYSEVNHPGIPGGIPNGYQMDTQVRIDKDSIGYISYSSSYIPTLQDIEDECREFKYIVDPKAFHTFYESRNWMSGGKPIGNWRGILCMWDRRLRELKDKPKGYTGNDITQADLDSLLERYAEVI